jgi:hypothetical protein
MHSNQLSIDGQLSTALARKIRQENQVIWQELVTIYAELLEDSEQIPRISEEMNFAGLGTNPHYLSTKLDQAIPKKAVRQYQKLNPQINVLNLSKEDPYEVVVGLVNLYSVQ